MNASADAPFAALPAPSADALAHSARLTELLADEIQRAGGIIGFERYMELALYLPGLGYYSAGSTKFGAAGDFVTAPEMSALFARCVARQASQVLEVVPNGQILEIGAGNGHLAADLLLELARLGRNEGRGDSKYLPSNYLILERSADLRHRQQETVFGRLADSGLDGLVGWTDTLPEPGFEGVIYANELLDALPVALFEMCPAGPLERGVSWDGGLTWAFKEPGPALNTAVMEVLGGLSEPLEDGYRSEIGLGARAWVRELGGCLTRGLMLLSDYGYPVSEYYHPQRLTGTLRCHYRHRAHDDPLLWPGLQDVTAHVDFTAIAESGRAAGLHLAGFTTQGSFLLGAGLLDMAAEVEPGSVEFARLTHEIKRLTLPGEMGDAVKFIGLTAGDLPPLVGFGERDFRSRLIV